jgi:hypothetical protein
MMQQRLTSQRLREFLQSAGSEEDGDAIHFVLLRGIGRAEVHTYFVDLPRQLRAFGGVLKLPWDLSESPTMLRENTVIFATEEQDLGMVSEREALDWSLIYTLEGSADRPIQESTEGAAHLAPILSAVRCLNPYKAKARIPSGVPTVDIRVVGEVLTLLHRNDVEWDSGLVTDAYLFMGNAWDRKGVGLFDSQTDANVHLASELWFRHSAIPRIWNATKGHSSLRRDIQRLISRRYSESSDSWLSMLESLN